MRKQLLNDRRYYGSICKWGHEYMASGLNLRYKSTRSCVQCSAIQMEFRKDEQKKYRNKPKNKKKALKYAKKYRKEHKIANN